MKIPPIPAEGLAAAQRAPGVQQAIAKALAGTLSRNRSLKYWEPKQLNEMHIQMILMRAAGFRQNEIARQLGVTDANVSVGLNHPDAQVVLATIIAHAADHVLDVRTRIKAHAGEMFDIITDLARNSPDENVKARCAFGILDRAGYGEVKKVEASHDIRISDSAAERLERAISLTALVQDGSYEVYTVQPADGGSAALSKPSDSPSDVAEPPGSGSHQSAGREAAA